MPSPLIRGKRLIKMMRVFREEAGLDGGEASALAKLGKATVSRLENGFKKPQLDLIISLLEVYGIRKGDDRYELAEQLARESLKRGWWDHPKFNKMDKRAKVYADLESGATSILAYQVAHFPGLLQSRDYIIARAEMSKAFSGLVDRTKEGVVTFDLDAMTAGRLNRQEEVFRIEGPKLEFIIEEAVIRRGVVASTIMAGQLNHMVEVAERYPMVSIRVLPAAFDVPNLVLYGSPFDLFTFVDPEDGDAALIPAFTQEVMLRYEETNPVKELYEALRAVALSEEQSASLIKAQAAEFAART